MLFIFLIVTQVYCQDICRQLNTYETCIGSKTEYCQWYPHQRYCRKSDDLMQGCDQNLSVKLCTRQISTQMATQALCIFDSICHKINDITKAKCNQNLNKYGCIGITNPQQLCKWEDKQCQYLSDEEIANLNTNFPNLILSMSVCPLITGHLIAHSNVLDSLSSSDITDYGLLAQQDDMLDEQKSYDEGNLQNNYLNSQGQFIWYVPQKQSQFNLLNLQINDQSRVGCIGIDISDDQMFRTLFNIDDQKVINGVNQIYCQYININPFNDKMSVFVNNKCEIINFEEVEQRTDLKCENLGRYACQTSPKNMDCQVVQPINQYEKSCIQVQTQSVNVDCEPLNGIATHKQCSQSSKYCFLYFNGKEGYCDGGCYNLITKNDCFKKSNCYWIDEEQNFLVQCSPLQGCTQMGLSRIYCENLALPCIWMDNQCKNGDLRILTCSEANTKYSCTHVQRQDQLCIWYNNMCINTITHLIFKNYSQLPENLIRNRNQCLMQDKGSYRYDEITKQCYRDYILDTQDLSNINKYFCLSLQLNSQWNYEQQKCQIIQPLEYCDNRMNINPKLCSYSSNCIYDEIKQSCTQLTGSISCNTIGLTKTLCISNLNEFCAWINNSCQTIKIFDNCVQLVNVSPYSCSMIDIEPCSYHNGYCIATINNNNQCQQFMNKVQCQKQQSECYYDLMDCKQIDNPTQYSTLNCNGLTQTVCIKNQKQPCIWYENQCQLYKLQYFDVCNNSVNEKACQQKIHNGKLSIQHFCEYDTVQQKCLQNINNIVDCGSNLKINLHRCVSFTQSDCYFYNYQCKQLSTDSNYKDLQLSTLKCSQVNTNICQKIKTPDQICIILNQGTFSTCIDISLTQQYANLYTCLQINSNLNGSPSICSLATDNCYYDSGDNECKIQTDTNIIYKCDDLISKSLCLTQTKYQCIFTKNRCKYYNNSYNNIDCQFRNIYSCETSGKNCRWNSTDKICEDSTNYCPVAYNQSHKVCQNGRGYCFNGVNGCVLQQLYKELPCNIALSQQLCVSQNHLCLWINNKCSFYPSHIKYCYQLQTQQECLSIQHLSCVFYKSQCIEDSTLNQISDYYDAESYQYCFNMQMNLYSNSQQCIQVLGNLEHQQNDIENTFNMQCQQTSSMITCIHQRSSKCTFNQQKCITSTLTSCIQEEGIFHSPQTCLSIPNCFWYSNKVGQGFCYQNQLSCDNIQLKSLCLSDFGLNCKYESNKCQDAIFTDCDQIQNIQVNYKVCKQLQPNCFYDFENNLCKKVNRKIIECTDAQNFYDCVYAYKKNCLVQYDIDNKYEQCQSISPNSFNANNNLNSCMELTVNPYKYNLKTYTCVIVNNEQEIEGCSNINQISCLKLTKQFQCIWYNSICQQYQLQDDLECDQLNYQVCLIQTLKQCIWLNDQCKEFENQSDPGILYSQGYCQGKSEYWNSLSNSCFTKNSDLVIIQCDNFGLDKSSCLKQNYIECYWNLQKCTSIINKVNLTCDNISNYNCDTDFNCKWNTGVNKCQDNSNSNLECSDYTYHSCIEISNKNCLFNYSQNKCQEIQKNSIILQNCHEYLSFQLCRLVKNQICTIYDKVCQEWTPRLFDCMYIQNQYGCMYAPMACQWLNNQCQYIDLENKVLCKDLPKSYNKRSCQQQSIDDCEFDDILLQCSQKIIRMEDINNVHLGNMLDTNLYLCEDQLNYNDCMSNFKQQCQWLNDKCVQSDLNQCMNQSYLSCLNNKSNCKWRNKRCYQFDNNENIEEIPILISPTVCSIFISDKKLKYSETVFSCVLSDSEIDDCDTIGLNDNACYNIKKSKCKFTNNICSFYQLDVQYQNCSQYKNINSKVCSSLQISCKYDESLYQCVSATDTDFCTTKGLSKKACLSITTEPCYWNNDVCSLFIADQNINQCDNYTQTNSLACQYIDYQQQICTYDIINHVCTNIYNRFQKCTQPGLNKYACVGLLYEPCQFVNNQCTPFTSRTSICYGIENVNSLACAIQVLDKCNYQKAIFSCYGVPLKIPCNSLGINQVACGLQANCVWDHDTTSCLYKTTPNINMCFSLIEDSCIQNRSCYYENNKCRLKRCLDLNEEECVNIGSLNNEICFLDIFNKCQIAKECEDIVLLNEKLKCDTIYFNQSSCYQINNNCVSSQALDKICPQTDCSESFCVKDNHICRSPICSDFDSNNCPKNNCAFMNGQCTQITTCSDIQELQICNLSTINNQQCSWQPSALRVGPYHCTNKPCYLFGSSWQFCQGNEMNDQTCFVTKYAQCESCEEQTDQATCLESKLCTFTNNKCKSILCKYFTNEQMCVAAQRCYWSQIDQVCRKNCEKIVEQEQCDILDYECTWNRFTYICENGPQQNPDLSYFINESDTSANIIKLVLIICLFYY
ncbi:unnamed protein product [Paramecium primaurelia]|uniref:Uncharacterized protein n=1 Tax=Paramecium primaurelia TaxID=5886 RepID=A0A8S1N5D1_PARPR|nr:unnamed protein product [Paramecium primaurelia]